MDGRVSHSADSLIEPLTRREREVLGLLSQGLTAPEIAEKLTIAVSSVKYHLQHIYGKLGANSRRQAVAAARDRGLLQPAPPILPPPTALSAASHPKHNLPQPLTRMIGRERDIEAIRQLLTDDQPAVARLVTLVGTGGAGKTRLALAIADEALAAYGNGVWLVELAPLSHNELLVNTVTASLGLRGEKAGADPTSDEARPLLAVLINFLQAKHCLLVLDNCEHLVDGCARLAEALLRACPRLQILATSREPLKLAGEVVWPVPGLAMPPSVPPTGQAPKHASEYAAVQLFTERARAARPDFRVTAQNATSLVQVCQLLDGLPLAIELAAARVALLPVEQIAALLASQERFRLLTGGGRTALPRHQPLLATIEWSFQLLSEAERTLLRRLPVFAGGWTLAAAEAVCGDGSTDEGQACSALPANAVLDALTHLASKSLVMSEPGAGAEARFHMLETIREFALGKLEEAGEADTVRQRHFGYFLQFAETSEPASRGPEQVFWQDRLETDHDNLRRALEWAVQRSETAVGLRLASALHYFWEVRGYSNEGFAWFNRLLADKPAPEPSAEWALSLARAAHLANQVCDHAKAGILAEASLALARKLGAAGQVSAAYAMCELGWVRFWDHQPGSQTIPQGSPSAGKALHQESHTLFELAGDDWGRARLLQLMGFFAKIEGDYQKANAAFQQSQAIYERLGDLRGVLRLLDDLGQLAQNFGDNRRAAELHAGSVARFRQLRDWDGEALALTNLAMALHDLGAHGEAMAAMKESIALLRGMGHLEDLPFNIASQAEIAITMGDYDQAWVLLEEVRRLAKELRDTSDWTAWVEMPFARIERARGDPAQSLRRIENVLPAFYAGNHKWWMAYSQEAMGEALRDLGEYERAAAMFENSLVWFRERGNWRQTTALILHLGSLARRQGDTHRAASLLGESLRRCQTSGLKTFMAVCLAQFACLALALAQANGSRMEAERAARLLGAYEALRRAMGLPMPPIDRGERVPYDEAVTALRQVLDNERLEMLWEEGAAMGSAAAVTLALAGLDSNFT